MDRHTAFVFLCVLIAHTACAPTGDMKIEAMRETIRMTKEGIETALRILDRSSLPPDVTCYSLNFTKLHTLHNIASLRCYLQKTSTLIAEVEVERQTICQYLLDMEQKSSDELANQDCSLPVFEQDMYKYVFLKCVLKQLDQLFTLNH